MAVLFVKGTDVTFVKDGDIAKAAPRLLDAGWAPYDIAFAGPRPVLKAMRAQPGTVQYRQVMSSATLERTE